MDASDLAELGRAKKILENPGFVAKLTNVVGKPMEELLGRRSPGPFNS
jgi:hypothetical protein